MNSSYMQGPELDYPSDITVSQLFESQADRTPGNEALVCGHERWTFARLNSAANRLARHLQALGVRPGHLVGLSLRRSSAMVSAQLAILKAGAAYVPLDPDYPAERTGFMVADSGLTLVVTHSDLSDRFKAAGCPVFAVDSQAAQLTDYSPENLEPLASPEDLCWVLYTSGSTGKPKGVMVSHRNVGSFLAAMDSRIPFNADSSWLAVTSLSFDISVLEIYWPLTRGLRVVLWPGQHTRRQNPAISRGKSLDFGLFFFANAVEGETDPYRVLMESARFADRNGFVAVWTPERHFHDFGGIYPNPSVAAAAIAAITRNVGIRAGSCVVPLHSPIRIAEEWAFVDRMSEGRVGIAAAAGWNADDFVIRPESFADRKERMFSELDTIRRLWRGEAIDFVNPVGKPVSIRTLPRPVQPELPVWITAAGNPDTFRKAGERGYFVLSHLLGQSLEDVSARISDYRAARSAAGHEGPGKVSLMIHTFVGEQSDNVREIVREPMINYLKSSFELVRDAAWAFPIFREKSEKTGKSISELFDERALTDDEIESLLEFSFERYFQTSGLFGTPEQCLPLLRRLHEIGVDEIACLIDFGIDPETVLTRLPQLHRLMQLASEAISPGHESIPELIKQHRVTHFQCTPTMARMVLMDPEGPGALAGLDLLAVGGEALPPGLAGELRSYTLGTMLNLYGPTETTIWSTVCPIEAPVTEITIGRPIANTTVYVLDESLKIVPIGQIGELFIGGHGVTKGYLNQPELTAQRFLEWSGTAGNDVATPARIYRTGDLVRMKEDGNLEYLGRTDQQVKIRGFRIELGEIEALLAKHPDVAEAVAVGRRGIELDDQLVAFVVPRPDCKPTENQLRVMLSEGLPEFMVPARIIIVESLPRTPNLKVDRNELAKMPLSASRPVRVASDETSQPDTGSVLPEAQASTAGRAEHAADARENVEKMAQIWREILGHATVSPTDNFFELGGNSLRAARLMSVVRERFGKRLPITTLLRAPTIERLMEKLES